MLNFLRSVTNRRVADVQQTLQEVSFVCLLTFRPCRRYKCTFYIGNHLQLGAKSSLINLTPNPNLILSSSNREPVTTGWAETDVAAPQSLLSACKLRQTCQGAYRRSRNIDPSRRFPIIAPRSPFKLSLL